MDAKTQIEIGMFDDAMGKANSAVSLASAFADYTGSCRYYENKNLHGGDCPLNGCNGTKCFVVNPNKNHYYCFNCGDKGDLVRFMGRLMKTGPVQTIKYLLDKYVKTMEGSSVVIEEEDKKGSINWRDKEVIPGYKVGSFSLLKGPYYFPMKYGGNFLMSHVVATKVEHNDKHEVILECDECFSVIGKLECGLKDGLVVKRFEAPSENKGRLVVECSCGRIIIRVEEMLYQMPEDWTM